MRLFLLLSCASAKIIQNTHKPICVQCIHYKPVHYNEFTSDLNQCGNFGKKNIVSGEIVYDLVSSCRTDESKCGEEGKHFEQEPHVANKRIMHAIVHNGLQYMLLGGCALYIASFLYMTHI